VKSTDITAGGSAASGKDDRMFPMNPQVSTQTYRVHGLSRPGGHGSIRCNTTTVKADTGSVSDGLRPGPAELLCASLAACLLKNIERFSEMLPFDYDVASVEGDG
jgi:uncharacterized OsmC-like protein